MNRILPKGIWYDDEKRKFRVRLYRDRKPMRGGYHDGIEDAIGALVKLEEFRDNIPKASTHRQQHQSLDFSAVCSDLLSDERSRTIVLNVHGEAS